MEMYSDNNGIKHMYNAEGKLSSAYPITSPPETELIPIMTKRNSN